MTATCLQPSDVSLNLPGTVHNGTIVSRLPFEAAKIQRSSSTPPQNSGLGVVFERTTKGLSCRVVASKADTANLTLALAYLQDKQSEQLDAFLQTLNVSAKLHVLSSIVDRASGANFLLQALKFLDTKGQLMILQHAQSVGQFADVVVRICTLDRSTDALGRDINDYLRMPSSSPVTLRPNRPQYPEGEAPKKGN